VPLANLAEPALIPLALREELRLPTDATEEPLEQVTKFLAARPGLVLLDNFEQLLPQGADVLVSMLRGMPEVRWLISSRQRLSLPGEVEFPVEALETPQAECAPESLVHFSSVQLFADRAKTARPSFELSPANAPVIAELCRKLDGVPLAMELAASRSDVVAPAEMLKELNERFNLCATNDPAIPPRHRSLRAAIDWSYDFLPAALRDYFENLSVFRGGWSVDAAAAVAHSREVTAHAGETRRALAELRAASLLRAEEMNGAMRFHMLETIRQYAAEKLSNQPRSTRVRLLHVNFFAELAERMESELHGSEADHWMSRIDTDRENVRAALAYAAEPALIARLSTSLTPYWIARALVTEGRRWLAQSHANRESLPPKLRSAVLYCCGTLAVQQADWPAARDSFAAALHEFRLAGDQPNVAALLSNLGVVAANNQEFAQAERYFAESVASYAALHHPTREALALINLGTIHLDRSDTSAAAEAYDRALELSTSTGDQAARALALHGLAQVHFHAGSLPEARARAEESLALNKKLRLHPRLAQNALLLACISSKSGADLHNIARWLGAADWLTREMEALASLRLQAAVAELRTRLRGELGPTILARESTNGRRMAQSWCGDTN
jgi:non-specific serine/threonine protein kinase